MNEIQEEQNIPQPWMQKEYEETKNNSDERPPLYKLIENKINSFMVDFKEPFPTWTDDDRKITLKMIPVVPEGTEQKMTFLLNVKNPLYNQILKGGIKGQKIFRVLRTGSQQTTRYTLME